MENARDKTVRQGIILKGIGGFYQVWQDNAVLTCKTRGKLRQDFEEIVVGDRVEFSLINEPGADLAQGVIERILPRKNQLVRPKAANIFGAVLVVSSVTPPPDWLMMDKMLITAAYHGLETVILINKCDLAKGTKKFALADAIESYRRAGYAVFETSAKEGLGVDVLRSCLSGGIWVFSGASGVGKSSLLNKLLNYSHMEEGRVSERLGRGRHTTRHAEIVPVELTPGNVSLIADTPGFSLLDLPETLEPQQLRFYYPEFQPETCSQVDSCRFDSCLHYREPDCRVKQLVEAGEINRARYDRYVRLLEILKEREVKY